MKTYKINITENVSHETNLFLPDNIKIFNKGIIYYGYCSHTDENQQILEKNSFIKRVIISDIVFFYFISQDKVSITFSNDSKQQLENPIYLFERTGDDLYYSETFYKILGIISNDLKVISIEYFTKNDGNKEICIKHQKLPICYFETDLNREFTEISQKEFIEKVQEGIKLLEL